MTSGKLSLVLLSMIIAAGFLIQLQPVYATFPGANGKIVFARNIGTLESPQYEIFTVNPDGSGLTQLTFTGPVAFNEMPRWSADGTKIVFMSSLDTPDDTDGNREIWIMNADGSGQTKITHTKLPTVVANESPAFSPDGSKIVFTRLGLHLMSNIWVMNADGSNQNQLTDTGMDFLPVWSPDGSKIAFYRLLPPSTSHIFVMNVDGSGQTDISDNSPGDEFPEWSPDGKMIAFASERSNVNPSIWVMNADGSNPRQLSNPPSGFVDLLPAWSPDGTKIAFPRLGVTVMSSLKNGFTGAQGQSIIVMNAADGSNPIDITQSQPHSDTDVFPNWQPIPLKPVGGVTLPTDKLEILTPYIALAGVIAAVSVVVVVKRRR